MLWRRNTRQHQFLSFAMLLSALLTAGGIAEATPIFKGDTLYRLDKYNTPGIAHTLFPDSTLYYDTGTGKLTVDAVWDFSVFGQPSTRMQLEFGSIMFAGGAIDNQQTAALDVSFPLSDSQAKFGLLPGLTERGKRLVGKLTNLTGSDWGPAGSEIRLFANMPAIIFIYDGKLSIFTWLHAFGSLPSGNYDFALDSVITLVEIPHESEIPEPMSLSLLLSGIFGSAFMRRKVKCPVL